MPSPATPDRRAASCPGTLQEWRTRGQTFRLQRSGSTRVSSSRSPRRLPSLGGRCRDDKRPNALSPSAIGVTTSTIAFSRLLERRAQAEGRCAVFALCAGVWRRPAFIRPHGRGWKVVGTAPVATIFAEEVASPKKHLRVGEEWAGTDILRTHSIASAQFDAPCSKQL